ncbi:MAG: ribulose-phosphate 3-epimerase [Deltaproteobacteria bacterium]|jgi:ribulose-phosphate 3-epimerase|nr:ribulose-phosphate 3-epimerase [Deltaproteobacteria bacterium]
MGFMIKIAPSILASDYGRLAEEIKAMEAAGADWIHIDIMDGHFVPNITFGPWVVEMARKVTNLTLDAHLMVSDPLKYAPIFAKAGADYVTVHMEASVHLHRTLDSIAKAGAKPGLVLNPATALSTLDSCLDLVELILLMSVNPGFGGQPFIPQTVEKTKRLRALLAQANLNVPIEIDGGVTDKNAFVLTSAGAEILVSGSHLFNSPDYTQAITALRLAAQGNNRKD